MAKKKVPKYKKLRPKSGTAPPLRDTKVFRSQRFMVWALHLLDLHITSGSPNVDYFREAIRQYILDRLCCSHPTRYFYSPTDEEIDELLKMDDDERRRLSVVHHFYIGLVAPEPQEEYDNP